MAGPYNGDTRAASQAARVSRRLCEDNILPSGEVAELAAQVVDDLFPGELAGGPLAGRAHLVALFGMPDHVQQIAHDLFWVVSLQRHSVLERDGVVLAGGPGE